MDRQHRPGARTGSGPMMSNADAKIDLQDRLRKIALDTIDIKKDPYFMQNHLGTYECRLCLTIHPNEGSYLAHSQGKKHQHNLIRRQARESKDNIPVQQTKIAPPKKRIIKIGRPGYKVIKQKDPETNQKSLLFEVTYKEINPNIIPKHRIMSAYEQKVETPDQDYQYLVLAADPYENIAFKIPNMEVDKSEENFQESWDPFKKLYNLHLTFKQRREIQKQTNLPGSLMKSSVNQINENYFTSIIYRYLVQVFRCFQQ